jgi:hypothetical protein
VASALGQLVVSLNDKFHFLLWRWAGGIGSAALQLLEPSTAASECSLTFEMFRNIAVHRGRAFVVEKVAVSVLHGSDYITSID